MSDHIGPAQSPAGGQFAAYEDELRAAEKKVAGEIDPGARALMVAVGVLVAMMSLVLPHTGQDPKGMILATTFYLESKPPYKVIGTSNQYN